MNELISSSRAPGLFCGSDVEVPDDASLGINVILCRGTKLGAACHIEHGAIVGRMSRIGIGSAVKPLSDRTTILGSRTIVGSYSIVCAGVQTHQDVFIGEHALVREDVLVREGASVGFSAVIGRGCIIGSNTRIQSFCAFPPNMIIEENCIFGPNVVAFASKMGSNNSALQPVHIRAGSRIGSAVQIMPGVVIGPNATVGAASVVTRDVPAGASVRGAPARIIGPMDR